MSASSSSQDDPPELTGDLMREPMGGLTAGTFARWVVGEVTRNDMNEDDKRSFVKAMNYYIGKITMDQMTIEMPIFKEGKTETEAEGVIHIDTPLIGAFMLELLKEGAQKINDKEKTDEEFWHREVLAQQFKNQG
jgi:hypothetical protein